MFGQRGVGLLGPLVHLLRAYGSGLGLLLRVRLLVLRPGARLGLVVLPLALVGARRARLLRVGLLALALFLALLLGLFGALLPALGALVGGLVGALAVAGRLLLPLLLLLLGLLPGGVALVLLLRAPVGVLLLGGGVRAGPAAVAAALLVAGRGVPLLLAGVRGTLVARTALGLLLLLPLDALDAEFLEEVELGQRHLAGLEFDRSGAGLVGDLQEPVVLRCQQPALQAFDNRVLQLL